MIQDTDSTVYVILYRDGATTAVVSVFEGLNEANGECLRLAADAGVTLETISPTHGPDAGHMFPVEPMRWDTADGASCWVEQHAIQRKRIVSPPGSRRKQHVTQSPATPSPQHNEDSELSLDHGPAYNDIVIDKTHLRRAARGAATS